MTALVRYFENKSYLLFFLISITISTALFFVDSSPRFFFGDSESYLYTTINGYYPTDRSWVYGHIIRPLIETTKYFRSIIFVQLLFKTILIAVFASACLLFVQDRKWIILAVILTSLEPLGIYMDRSVMTDGPASMIYLATLAIITTSVIQRKASIFTIILLSLCVATLLFLRVAYLPVLAGLSLILAAWALWISSERRNRLALFLLLMVGIGTGALIPIFVNGAFKSNIGYTYNRGSPSFMLGVIAPSIEKQNIVSAGLKISEFDALNVSDFNLRNYQIFGSEGLNKTLNRENSELTSDELDERKRRIFHSVIRTNPDGLLALYLKNLWLYINPTSIIENISNGTNIREKPFSKDFEKKFINPYVMDELSEDFPSKSTFSESYLIHMGVLVWMTLIVCILSPLLVVFIKRELREPYLILALGAFGYVLSLGVFSVELIPRYIGPSLALAIFLSLIVTSNFLSVYRRGALMIGE